ncbi:multidrug efflux SMR transporter [Virgibacillus sp. NKC19-3]|uniref:DMT family transporter n=1 Tax=Virgibacillus saliphilus TaxID=2831674 RepID=UPI001C9AFBE3|nr:multidrug efflux SMR transporter [Virgibacillus sp. NKC19-3]MBY7144731.1 multidrug efflux SMR transporter [Virgibacillus sp. NKC19-3]
MNWFILIIAGLFEVVGVTGMQKIAKGEKVSGFSILVAGFLISFTLLSVAMETIPLGIAYGVWTGMGTVGSAIVGMIFYNESTDRLRLMFMGLVIVAVVGLRVVSA